MAKTVYYAPRAMEMPEAPTPGAAPAVLVRPRRRSFGKATPFILAACVLLAVLSVLLVPMLVGGATKPETTQADVQRVACASWQEAAAVLDIEPTFPAALPDGYTFTACYIVDGRVLEAEFADGRQSVVLRVAAGNEDLSGADYEALAYTATETVGDVTRGYAGVSEKKLTCAVWAVDGYAYALVAGDGMDAAAMRLMAESVA